MAWIPAPLVNWQLRQLNLTPLTTPPEHKGAVVLLDASSPWVERNLVKVGQVACVVSRFTGVGSPYRKSCQADRMVTGHLRVR